MSETAATCRRLMRSEPTATLATALGDGGWPYASLVLVAVDHAAEPILLLSKLAEHTRSIAADDRVSLLLDGTRGWREPLAGPRVTVLGRVAPTDDATVRARFLARHPGAAVYADFADFAFYRVAVERAHLVAGFGRIEWLPREALLFDAAGAAELAEAEARIVEHMNADHGDAVALYANVLCGRPGIGWRMTGVDPEGADLARPGDHCRLDFARPVTTPNEARAELVRLVRQARESAAPA